MRVLTFQISEEMADGLRKTAQRDYCSVGSVIRRAVAAYVAQYEVQEPRENEDEQTHGTHQPISPATEERKRGCL